jgi:hypothetical protein
MAGGINDAGQIVGLGASGGQDPYHDMQLRHFLLTPPPLTIIVLPLVPVDTPLGASIPPPRGATLAARVLFGVVQDAPGVVLVGKQPHPVGPGPGGVSPVSASREAGGPQGAPGDVAAPRRRRWFGSRWSGG